MNIFQPALLVSIFLVSSCADSTSEDVKRTYAVKEVSYTDGKPALAAAADVKTNHVGLQEKLSKNAFTKICEGPYAILEKQISEPRIRSVRRTTQTWHAASGQLIQSGSYPVDEQYVHINYVFRCA